MLSKNGIKPIETAYWCLVSGSEIWLVNNKLPCGTVKDLSLPQGMGKQIGEYEHLPVIWLNADEVEISISLNLFFEQALKVKKTLL